MTWVPTRRPVAAPLAALWAQLYPCALARRCQRIQFDAEQGLLPRGIYAPPTLGQVRLLVLAHNPGDPQPGELAIFRSAASGRDQVEVASALTYDSFVRALLPPAQRRRSPDHKPKRYHPRLLRVLMAALGDRQPLEPEAVLEQVVCSNLVKCQLLGAQTPTVTLTNCTSTYLQREFALLPAVPVLAWAAQRTAPWNSYAGKDSCRTLTLWWRCVTPRSSSLTITTPAPSLPFAAPSGRPDHRSLMSRLTRSGPPSPR